MVTPSREAAQMPSSATSKWGLGKEVRAALLRVRTGPECPEGDLRELTWDRKPDPGIATLAKSPKLRHRQVCSQNKGMSQLWTGPSPARDRERGQPEPEVGDHSPQEASPTKLQAGFIANLDFLRFWMVNIRLRRWASCTVRKPSRRNRRGDK